MNNGITVLVKQPGMAPETRQIKNDLAALQEIVGGYIEMYGLGGDMTVICNEEGKLTGLPFNIVLNGETFVGPLVVAATKGDDLGSLSEVQLSWARGVLESGK